MRVLTLVAMLLASGCSVYIPRNMDAPPAPGTDVRARLTTEGAVRVSETTGGVVREVEGELLFLMGDSVGMGVLSTTEYGRPWDMTDTLWLGRGEILQLEEKKIDRRRTAFMVGGAGIITGVVVAALFRASGGSEEGDPPGEIDVTLLTLLKIRH